MKTQKKWENPQCFSSEVNNTKSGSGTGVAYEAVNSPSTQAVLGS